MKNPMLWYTAWVMLIFLWIYINWKMNVDAKAKFVFLFIAGITFIDYWTKLKNGEVIKDELYYNVEAKVLASTFNTLFWFLGLVAILNWNNNFIKNFSWNDMLIMIIFAGFFLRFWFNLYYSKNPDKNIL